MRSDLGWSYTLAGAMNTVNALAARLVDEKIADLRSYETLPTTAGKIAYQGIGADTGGAIPSGTETVSNVTYTRSWTVADYYYPITGVAPTYGVSATTTLPSPAPAYPHFKLATVTIQWTDKNNDAQSIAVSAIISSHDPAKSGKAIG